MDHKLQCMSFKPPAPLSMAAHFDQVLQGRAKPAMYMSVWVLDEVLRAIHARPNLVEQAALLNELELRFLAFGRPRGWLKEPGHRPEDGGADAVTTFILQDVLGISGATANDKALAAFKTVIKSAVKDQLNSKGKTGLKLLQVMIELGSARTGTEVARILGKLSVKELGSWLASSENIKWLTNTLLKSTAMKPVTRLRLVKLVAARLTWLEVTLSRLAWVSLWLLALDLLLTPERIADDATEARLTFLTAYGRVFAGRASQFGQLVRTCHAPEWDLAVPLHQALSTAIVQGH